MTKLAAIDILRRSFGLDGYIKKQKMSILNQQAVMVLMEALVPGSTSKDYEAPLDGYNERKHLPATLRDTN